MNEPLAAMFEYNRWANTAILDACEALDADVLDATVPGTYGSIREMVVHIIRGQYVYLGHMSGDTAWYERAPALDAAWPGFEALRDGVRRTDGEFIEVARALAADVRITLPDSREGMRESYPKSFILLEALYHGIEHRGQICTTMSQAGVTPPELDGWVYATATGLEEIS